MQFDPVAAMQLWAVEVELAGRWYRIAPRPAAEWITTIMQDGWLEIVPGWCDESDDLDEAMCDGTVGVDECVRAAQDALAENAGTLWWAAVRLIHMAAGDGLGELWLSGMDPRTVPLGAVIHATYRLYTREMNKSQRAQLDMRLEQTPPGVSAEERYDEQRAADMFEQMAARRGMAA